MSPLDVHAAALLTARITLGAAAFAVLLCCLHVKRLHAARLRPREAVLFAVAVVVAVATGALVDDLGLATLADLAVLLAVVVPTVALTVRRG